MNVNFGYSSPVKDLEIVNITEKLDGSMVLVGRLPNGELITKTKSSIYSEQALKAQEFLNKYEEYREFCKFYVEKDNTPHFEYTSPDNQIVLCYDKEELALIMLIDNKTGDSLDITQSRDIICVAPHKLVSVPVTTSYKMSLEDLLRLQSEGYNEGYVVLYNDGLRVKFKTLSYCLRHKQKELINNKKNLTELVLEDKIDDVLPLFKDDKDTLKMVEEFSKCILEVRRELINNVSNFYNVNRELARKDYAVLAHREENKDISGLLMDKYLGRESNLTAFIIKRELYKIGE